MYQTLDVDLSLFLSTVNIVCDVDCKDLVLHSGVGFHAVLRNRVHKFDQSFMLFLQFTEECFYLIQRMLHCEESEYIHVYRIL